jgi:UDP-N-acetylmuramoyl-L-alanyl-D-glutamate--2,6-diaminopimelate ligase
VGDEHGRRLAAELRALGHDRLITFGFAPDADVRPHDLQLSALGASFDADGVGVRSRLLGRSNVENVLGAVAAARLLGLPQDAVAGGVERVEVIPGRLERVDEGQPFTLFVDYSHKPQGLESVLRTARELADGRVLCVFGCGGDRDREKRPVMGRIASELADLVVVTSDNPRSEDPLAIIREIVEGAGPDVEVVPDRRRAIAHAVEMARPGDVVVIAGKGHEQGQEVGGETLPFDDREVAREALRRLGART